MTGQTTKVVVPKVSTPDTFHGDRKKFRAYNTQVRIYYWAEKKRPSGQREFTKTPDKILWAASFLRGEAYTRFEPYLTSYLTTGWHSLSSVARHPFESLDNYFDMLKQSYGDLDEVRTAEQELLALRQKGSVPEYLTRFTQYAARVTWDERARMNQFYVGLK